MALFSAGSGPPGFAAAGPVSPDDAIYELPKYTVTGTPALPPPEAWRYAEFPGFTVLSNASDRKTQRLLGNFEWFRYAVGIVWPLPEKTSVPVSVIVCGARNTFDGFVPEARRHDTNRPLSFLLRDREHGAIVIDAQTAVFFSGGPAEGFDGEAAGGKKNGYEVESANLLCREYVRFLFSRQGQELPVWMEEGLIQIFLAMKITQGQIALGRVEDPNLAPSRVIPGQPYLEGLTELPEEDKDFNGAMAGAPLIPLGEFFAASRDSPRTSQIYGNNRWVKQAYAFVHMCVFGRGGRFRKPFVQFLQRANQAPVTEEMFRQCFSLNYRQMQLELRLYMNFTDYEGMEYNFKKGKGLPTPTPLALRDAEESESARIKGDALLLGGHFKEAQAVLLPAYVRGSRDPGLLATLGLSEHMAGRDDRARKFLEAAVARKVVRPEAYLALARLRFGEAAAQPAAGMAFSEEQVARITGLLYVARHQPPHLPALYELLAETWLHSAMKPQRDDVLVLIQGATLFPDHFDYVCQVATYALAAGIFDAARPMIEHGLGHTADPQLKSRFEQLKASLPPVPGR